MGLLDALLFPMYVLLFYFIFSIYRRTIKDPVLRRYHLIGFWIKVFAALAFTVFNFYISPGDSWGLYQTEGANIKDLILKDGRYISFLFGPGTDFDEALLKNIFNAGYFAVENNFIIVKLTAIFSFFTFSRYLLNNLIFSLISFTGVWKLFQFFYFQYPHLHKQIALAILFLPNFIFWSSGVLKDPICTGALGWLTYCLYQVLYKRENILINVLMIFIAGYFLAIIKLYILISYVPIFFLFVMFKNVSLVNSKILKTILLPIILIGSLLGFMQISKKMETQLDKYAVDGLSETMVKANGAYTNVQVGNDSQFSLGVEFDGSPLSLLKIAPSAIVATLFRPFIWEVSKISQLLSAIESLVILIFTIVTIFKVGIIFFVKTIVKDPTVLYCFLFSILFALFVGATTGNFGTLVRYKIPCVPFYIMSIILIKNSYMLSKVKNLKPSSLNIKPA
jgi:hypothetical protein